PTACGTNEPHWTQPIAGRAAWRGWPVNLILSRWWLERGRPAPRPAAPTGGSGPLAGRVEEGELGHADPHLLALVVDGQLHLEGRARRGVLGGHRGQRDHLLEGRGPGGARSLADLAAVPVHGHRAARPGGSR